MTRARWPALWLFLAAGCGGETFHPRPIVLASSERGMDQALQRARLTAFAGDYDAAREQLRGAIARYPHDPLLPVVSVLLARVDIARNDLAEAEQTIAHTVISSDPVLARKVNLVRGVIAARRNLGPQALELLRPLEGQLPDRGETGELSCGLADAEVQHGDPARALRALATIEMLQSENSSWLTTGLACERLDTRAQMVRAALERIVDAQVLANTVDALPAESTMRRPVEVRLHALAESAHEVSRWIHWLGDLPDETDVNAAAHGGSQRATLVVGILAPGQGVRASLGVSVLRGVQFALEAADDVRTVNEDEGDSPEAAVGALDRLYAQGARVVVGVLHEDLSAAVAIRAQALGIDAWLLAPTRGIEGAGARVHVAGPTVDARAEALSRALRALRDAPGAPSRVALLAAAPVTEVRQQLERALTEQTIAWTDVNVDAISTRSPGGVEAVVLGTYGREARGAFARAAEHAVPRWMFEARAAAPGSAGTWVGLAPGPAFATFVREYCTRIGEPPEELTLLAYDAARRGVATARGEHPMPPAVLAMDRAMVFAVVGANGSVERASPDGVPAAAMACPSP